MAAGKKKPEEKDPDSPGAEPLLRKSAEKKLARSKKIPPELKEQTPEQLVHELQVHQIELETQAEELRRAHLALEESRDKYLDLYDFAPLGYLTLTDKALIAEVNLTGAVLLGAERNKLVRARFRKFIAPEDHDRWYQYFTGLIRQDDRQSCTLTIVRGDGAAFPARLEGIRIPGSSENTCSLRISISDISDIRRAEKALTDVHDNLEKQVDERTAQLSEVNRDLRDEVAERKKTEDTLRESREILQAFLNATTDTLILLDPDGTILAANAYSDRSFPLPPESMIGRNAFEYLPPETAKHRKEWIAGVVASGKPAEHEDERDGRYVQHHLYPVFSPDGRVRRIAIYARDITKRKQAEKSLVESEERFRMLLQNVSSVAVQGYGMDGTTQFWNKASENLYGYTPDEAIGRNLLDLIIPPEMRDDVRKAMTSMAETGQPIPSSELSLMRKDGSRVSVFSSHAVVRRSAGGMELFCLDIDLTGRKEAEAALSRSEEKFRTLFENAPVLIDGFDHNGRCTLWNRECESVFGWSMEEINAQAEPLALFYPDPIVRRQVAESVISRPGTQFREWHPMTREGNELTVLWANFPLPDGTIINIGLDITERKRSEEALRQSEEKFRTLFESMAPGVFYQLADGTLVDANPAALSMFGLTSGQFAGRDSYDPRWKVVSETGELLAPEQHPSMCALRSGKPVKDLIVGVYNPARDDMTWLSTNAEPQFRSGEATPYQVFVTMYDITERRQAEMVLQVSKEELGQKNVWLTTLYGMEQEFAELPSEKSIEELAAKKLSLMSGAVVTVFSTYDPVKQLLNASVIEIAPGILKGMPGALNTALGLLGKGLDDLQYPLSNAMYQDINRSIVGTKKTITELSYGMIPPIIGTSIQKLAGIDHFIHIAHVIDGELYGTSVLGIKSGLADPPTELLQAFAHIVAASLRRQKAEGALRQSEEKYRIIAENTTDTIWIFDLEFHLTYMSPSVKKLRGFTVEEAMNQTIDQMMTAESIAAVTRRFEEEMVLEAAGNADPDRSVIFETDEYCRDGRIIRVENSARLLRDADGNPFAILGISHDITERKRAEEAQRQSERRYRELVENLNDVVFTVDQNGFITFVSQVGELLYGYSPADLVGKPFTEVVFREDVPVLLERFKEIGRGKIVPFEWRLKHRDGSLSWVRSSTRPVMDAEGTSGFSGIISDISREKQAEQELRESESRARAMIRAVPDLVFRLDRKGVFLDYKADSKDLFTPSETTLLGRRNRDLTPPEFADLIDKKINAALESGAMQTFDYQLTIPGRGVREYEARMTASGPDEVTAIVRDITDTRRAEDKLRESERSYRRLFNTIRQAIYILDTNGILVDGNDGAEAMFAYSRDEVIGKTPELFAAPDKNDMAAVMENVQRALAGEPQFFVFWGRRKSGEIFPIDIYLYKGTYFGKDVVIAIGSDITERRAAEQAIQDLSTYNRSLIEASLDPLVTISPEGKITDVNAATEPMTGYSRNHLIGTDFSDYFTDPEKARVGYQTAFDEGVVRDYPLEIKSREGKIRQVLYNAAVYRDESGRVKGVFAAARDITERMAAELVALDLSTYNRNLVEASLDPLVIISSEGKVTDVNAATERMTGYSRDYLVGTDFSDYFTDPGKARNGYRKVFEQGAVQDYPLEIKNREGIIRQVLYNAAIYRDESDHVRGVIATAHDITRRKHDEDVLRISNNIFSIANLYPEIALMLDDVVQVIREFTGCDSVGIRLLDTEGNIPYSAYSGFADSFYKRECPLNIVRDECMCIYVIRGDANPDLPVITPKGSFWCNGTTKFLAGISDEDKGRTRNVCNEMGYESVALVAIRQGEKILGLVHLADHREGMVPLGKIEVIEDCSQALGSAIQRLIAETETRHSLAEKEVLLREIHHRVKNNLAGIISLIDLQINTLTDPANISLLRDLETRVRSMALVHESLYLTKDLAQINFGEYSENLTRYLFQVYGTRVDIRCRIEMGDVKMPIGTAIPCGLVMSEIVTNALKYAFPDTFSCTGERDEPCTIALTLSCEGKDYRLTISDNGIGIPERTESTATHSLGLYLIGFIVKHQLRGTLEINTEKGTVYTIRFSEPEGKERKDDG